MHVWKASGAVRRCYPVVHEGYRRSLIRRFPYVVFYEQSGETVTIYAVFHTSRGPDKSLEPRLPSALAVHVAIGARTGTGIGKQWALGGNLARGVGGHKPTYRS
jgi:hypothetical protein